MLHNIKYYLDKYISHPEALVLITITAITALAMHFMGDILVPIIASLILAYCLEWFARELMRFNITRNIAVWIVFSAFIGIFIIAIVIIFPIIWQQGNALVYDLPNMLNSLKANSKTLLSEQQLSNLYSSVTQSINTVGRTILTVSWSSISSIMTWLVYVVLVPVMVFFMLKDKEEIIAWVSHFLPAKRTVLKKILTDLNIQIGNYIRGKIIEMIAIGLVSYIAFWFVNLKYNALLAFLIGFSAIIPFVGAIVVTIPLILVAFLQFGLGSDFMYVAAAHLIIQTLDGNVLVPILFSGALNLHPLAILIAVLVFGGIWGVWGVFFAIPLATLIKILINCWPTKSKSE